MMKNILLGLCLAYCKGVVNLDEDGEDIEGGPGYEEDCGHEDEDDVCSSSPLGISNELSRKKSFSFTDSICRCLNFVVDFTVGTRYYNGRDDVLHEDARDGVHCVECL